jgi:AraC family transcriptional regulator, ethanolamine operon transcriptional activator
MRLRNLHTQEVARTVGWRIGKTAAGQPAVRNESLSHSIPLDADSIAGQSDALCPPRQAPTFPRVEERVYSDVALQAGSVPGHEQQYSQLSPRAFEGNLLTYAVSDRVSFFVERTNVSIRKRFSVSPGHLRLGFVTNERHHCCGNGKILPGDAVSANFPTTSLDLHFPETYKEYEGSWITLDLNSVIQVGVGEVTRDLNQPDRFQVSGRPVNMLRNVIGTARKELFAPESKPVSPRIAAAFEKTLLSMAGWIVTAALDVGEQGGRISPAHRARCFRRACEVIDARLGDDLTMQELCSFVGASRRSLENIFLETLGVSPYQYVRMIRLNLIRKELLAAENQRVPIGDIAAKYGIWHLSRFAYDYKRVFGHLPSQGRRLALSA